MKAGHEIIENALADAISPNQGFPFGMSYEQGMVYKKGLAAAYLHALEMIPDLQPHLGELNQKVDALQQENASLKQDATRYQDFKANSHIRFSLFSGRCRADNGHSILTDWLESFDECFDAAMQASKQ